MQLFQIEVPHFRGCRMQKAGYAICESSIPAFWRTKMVELTRKILCIQIIFFNVAKDSD